VGHRFELPYTRAIIRAALTGALEKIATHIDPYFGLPIPVSCPDVPSEVLDPVTTWKDKAEYEMQAKNLAGRFIKNFEQYLTQVKPEVVKSGPSANRMN